MAHPHYIYNLNDSRLPPRIGGKAQKLRFLLERGCRTPTTYICTWDAYLSHLYDDPRLYEQIKAELMRTIDLHRSYAVRSSANIEDGSDYSFAGQFKSILNVTGIDQLMHALETIWSSTNTPSVRAYLERMGIDQHQLKMAVIIQEMVPPSISGVSFSRNPMTGMDEIIVEAAAGSGEMVLQNGVTPARWINKRGEWIMQPGNGHIDLSLIQEVVATTKKISHAYGSDIDLEWVYDGTTINWVQLREITSLKNIGPYSNHFSKEVFPGIIKPLVWSTNVPIVCGAWVRLFTELIGENDIDPNSLAKSFYYRAYFNMGTIGKIFEALGLPKNTIELLIEVTTEGFEKPSFKPTRKTLSLVPRMLRFVIEKLRFDRKLTLFLSTIKPHYASFTIDQIDHLSPREIISEIEKLYALNEKTAYYTIVTFLLMGLYHGILKYQLKKVGVDFEQFDLTRGMDELKRFDPNAGLKSLHHSFKELDEEVRITISKSTFQEFVMLKGIESLQQEVQRFITHFGHLSDSGNDLSSVPWRENPDLILTMVVHYAPPEDKAVQKLPFEHLPLSALRRCLLSPIYQRARTFRLHREEVSFLYTFGYGLFRAYFLALANHFVRRGFVTHHEDIFFLSFSEIQEIVEKDTIGGYAEIIDTRRREIKDYQNIILPNLIYGDHPPPVSTHTGNILKGIPTSKGYYSGRVRVVQGIQDLHKVREGDVLIIPYSDVGLTPLFSKAGAIIAESGGFLSHSSIIAREYGIPAIVSVAGACHLKDDTLVTVNGYQGEITIQHA